MPFLNNKKNKEIVINLNKEELKIIVKVIKLVLKELESPELETRMGTQRSELVKLANKINNLI